MYYEFLKIYNENVFNIYFIYYLIDEMKQNFSIILI